MNDMQLSPFTVVTGNNWMELRLGSDYAGVPVSVLIDAITTREVRATTAHPERPGDWMVPLSDVDEWLRRRDLARAVFG
jgi:hypothetical protein